MKSGRPRDRPPRDAGQAAGPHRARDEARPHVRLRGHAHPRLPRIQHDRLNRVQQRFENASLPTLTQQSPHVRDMMATEDPYVTGRAAEVYYAAQTRNRVTLRAIERALLALVPVKGRKSLVIVSDGFVYDTHLDGFRRVVDASRRANTAIYFVNSRGLEGMPTGMDAETSTILPGEDLGYAFREEAETTEGSTSLAADTAASPSATRTTSRGGSSASPTETRAYYLIGYNPTNAARDGAFRKIEVKVPGGKGRSRCAPAGATTRPPTEEIAASRPGRRQPRLPGSARLPLRHGRAPHPDDALRRGGDALREGAGVSWRPRWTSGGSTSRTRTAGRWGSCRVSSWSRCSARAASSSATTSR